MQKHADIKFQDHQFLVTGNLDFSNVIWVYKKSLLQMHHQTQLVFDFSGLKSSNSAGFALIIEWVKFAKQHHQSIAFTNLPSALLSIAKIAGLDKLLA